MDKETWRSMPDELEQRFENTHRRIYDFNRGGPMYLKIAELDPWSFEKVQGCKPSKCFSHIEALP